ncbi:MAG: DNA translocase FtsK [bacterium]
MRYSRKKKFNFTGILSYIGQKIWNFFVSIFDMIVDTSPETKRGVGIIFLFVFSALCWLGVFHLYGTTAFGNFMTSFLSHLLGGLAWILPTVLLLLAYFLLREEKYEVKSINYLGSVMLIFGIAYFWHLTHFDASYSWYAAGEGIGGGYVGAILSLPLLNLMGFWGALVVTLAIFIVGILLTFETSIHGLMWPMRLFKFLAGKAKSTYLLLKYRQYNRPQKVEADDYEEEDAGNNGTEVEEVEDTVEEKSAPAVFTKTEVGDGKSEPEAEIKSEIAKPKKFGKKIELPLDLLIGRSGKPTSGDIKANQETIRKTLANFGINVEMAEVNVGPTVTQYTFRPADGVKLSRIINLNSDLALSLASHPIRIEAPIPGRSLVGIEVPNQLAAKVTMNDLLQSKEFKERGHGLSIALGKDVSGKAYFADLDRMPHLLIAGATGSGKSVCINSVIVSLLYQNSPDDLKFILIDPKRVELPVYNGIPYLLTPVITDTKKTINALKWAITEMERRFDLLARLGKRNIASYNQGASDRLPYIVIVIDELADLMATSSADIEGGIVRLAQMARAVGIHLILATQRPSVEVITGLIKANIPARISFSVASLIDSRTILDSSGAEKLVGRGDMLYLGPEVSRPKRLQGVYLSDKEISNVIDYIKSQGEPEYINEIVDKQSVGSFASGGHGDDGGDPLMQEALDVIRQSGKASASLLQRRLKLGYARAARILDLLEDQGIIGAADGAKPREVFLEKLGGVNAVEFAAHEYDLEGELKEEPSFTDFSYKEPEEEIEEEDVENEENIDEENPLMTDEEIVQNKAEAESDEPENIVEEIDESPVQEEVIEEAEEIEEDEEVDKYPKKNKDKKVFDNDEWS